MISPEQLNRAQEAGLLKAEQVPPLLAFLNEPEQVTRVTPDPEEVHFIKGFHDFFITIGLIIFFIGFGASVLYLLGEKSIIAMLLLILVMSWLLAEWFTRKLRLALPSVLLAAVYMGSGIVVSLSLLDGVDYLISGETGPLSDGKTGLFDNISTSPWFMGLGFVAGIGLGWLFHWRFRVPITPALMMLSLAGLIVFALGNLAPALLNDYTVLWMFVIAVLCFVAAMVFDMRDPNRQTTDSDRAFWLHLLAAPLLVHAILSDFSGKDVGSMAALAILLLVAGLALVALIIDRRAILASALGYIGIALSSLLKDINFDETGIFALTLLVLGGFVLLLGSGWKALRAIVLKPLSGFSFLRHLPPVQS